MANNQLPSRYLPRANQAHALPHALTPLRRAMVGLFGLGVAFSAGAQTANGYTLLGIDPAYTSSSAHAISADGSTVVGHNERNGWERAATSWTSTGEMTILGGAPAGFLMNSADAVSADGSVVVGTGQFPLQNSHAFIWAGGNATIFQWNPGKISEATGVSADGSVVVGWGYNTVGSGYSAFRRTGDGTILQLDHLEPAARYTQAWGVSADGKVTVGYSVEPIDWYDHAVRWTEDGRVHDLGTLGGGNSYGRAASADGSVVVGISDNSSGGREAFRWTEAGMIGLGDLAGGSFYSYAFAVSANGAVVVGESNSDKGLEGFRWTQAGGMVSVASWLTAAGVTLPATLIFRDAAGVSADGSTLVGDAEHDGIREAYLARVSPLGSGVINPDEFNRSVMEAGIRGLQLPVVSLFGGHHRSLLDNGLPRVAQGNCAWATGDVAGNYEADARMGIAEVGVCKDIGSARFGIGIGQAWARQDWHLGGGARYDGQYVIAEVANAFANGLQPSLTGYYGRFDTSMNRNYRNGANVDTSRGNPNATAKALRLRIDWKDAARLGRISFSPYAAYTWMRTELDGYTETGGGFPVRFNATDWDTNDIRLGVAGRLALGGKTDLRVGVEAVHRFEGSSAGNSGEILGLSSFAARGERLERDWARLTVDVDHRLKDNLLLTLGANGASNGGDANWGLMAGVKVNF